MNATRIRGLSVRDIRFPSGKNYGENNDEFYLSCAYVILYTDTDIRGHALIATNGAFTELVVSAVKMMSSSIVGQHFTQIFGNFGDTWKSIMHNNKMDFRSGVAQLASSVLINALFDLWSRALAKPLWKMLVDMTPEKLVSVIDFTYIADVLSEGEAIEIINSMRNGREAREDQIMTNGYPASIYIEGTSIAEQKTPTFYKYQCRELKAEGWSRFKMNIGNTDLEMQKELCAAARDAIGPESKLILCGNHRLGVREAIELGSSLADAKPLYIQDPTSPDDVLGHLKIKEALSSVNIGVACGSLSPTQVVLKQFLQSGATDWCQINPSRMGGIPAALASYLMAKKMNINAIPHTGDLGLLELALHLQVWDYISVSGTRKNKSIAYTNTLTEHFKFKKDMKNCSYIGPTAAGSGVEMWSASLAAHEYPYGSIWTDIFSSGLVEDPRKARPPYIEKPVNGAYITHR